MYYATPSYLIRSKAYATSISITRIVSFNNSWQCLQTNVFASFDLLHQNSWMLAPKKVVQFSSNTVDLRPIWCFSPCNRNGKMTKMRLCTCSAHGKKMAGENMRTLQLLFAIVYFAVDMKTLVSWSVWDNFGHWFQGSRFRICEKHAHHALSWYLWIISPQSDVQYHE